MASESSVTLVEEAYRRIKGDILSNRMPPGFQSPEPAIAAGLGMSRTPVREALLRLESEGLVELIPRRGARILPISVEDMREIYEILSALEPEAAAQLATRSHPDGAFDALSAATGEMEAAVAAEDVDKWAEADDRFHRSLLELHGNKRLTSVVGTLFDQANRVRMMTLRLRDLPVRSTQDHRQILEHIMAGEADKARTVFREHRVRASRELLSILEKIHFPF